AAGGEFAAAAPVDITFDDAASSLLPTNGPLVTNLYQPTAYNMTTPGGTRSPSFNSPAPAAPWPIPATEGTATLTTAALTNNFLGINPNGAWSLYVQDNVGLDSGAVDGGWSITITPTYSVTNSAAIQFDNLAATNPYPSQMVVSGLPGN